MCASRRDVHIRREFGLLRHRTGHRLAAAASGVWACGHGGVCRAGTVGPFRVDSEPARWDCDRTMMRWPSPIEIAVAVLRARVARKPECFAYGPLVARRKAMSTSTAMRPMTSLFMDAAVDSAWENSRRAPCGSPVRDSAPAARARARARACGSSDPLGCGERRREGVGVFAMRHHPGCGRYEGSEDA